MLTTNNNPATTPNLPPDVSPANSWDPSTIANIIFGISMVFIGIIAIWQGSRRRRGMAMDEEELVFIRPARTSSLSMTIPANNTGPSVAPRPPRFILPDASASHPERLAIDYDGGNGHSEAIATATTELPTSPNRVTTLSTLASQ